MKFLKKINVINIILLSALLAVFTCEDGADGVNGVDGTDGIDGVDGTDGSDGADGSDVSLFATAAKISLGDGVSEISTYDAETQTVFATNSEAAQVEVIDISDVNSPQILSSIDVTAFGGNVNSVASQNGFLAIAVEAATATDNGSVVIFRTDDLTTPYAQITAGALPDMVTFTPDGTYVIAANEGEPDDDYTIDPVGSVTVINVETQETTQVFFDSFNASEAALEAEGFRVFGPGATLAEDVEPEYITVSSDSQTAYIALQENNGIAVLDLMSKTITDILPLGTKDYSDFLYDVSNRDGIVGNLNNWPVFGYYQPDAIDYFEIGGMGYIISANEGDARDYDGYSEEERVNDITLDPDAFEDFDIDELQADENLGRLNITTAFGDTDNDGDFDEIYCYGARSFSIWSTSGDLIFDSGNEFTLKALYEFGNYPDNRSDDKGTEPESVTTYTEGNNTFAVIGLERSGDVLVYNINDVYNPRFVQRLRNTSPEGLLIISAEDSPNGNTLLVVANEFPDDATLNIYSK